MNENIDLTKILENCPEGTKLYSTVHGEVQFDHIEIDSEYPIRVTVLSKQGLYYNILFTKYGILLNDYPKGECILFPSKEQRDWSKFTAPWYKKERFDPKTLKPFDKVLAASMVDGRWVCDFFSHIGESIRDSGRLYVGTGFGAYDRMIPYNDKTKHLIGTTDESPEYYRYWED